LIPDSTIAPFVSATLFNHLLILYYHAIVITKTSNINEKSSQIFHEGLVCQRRFLSNHPLNFNLFVYQLHSQTTAFVGEDVFVSIMEDEYLMASIGQTNIC
jgi:hypothetical protein